MVATDRSQEEISRRRNNERTSAPELDVASTVADGGSVPRTGFVVSTTVTVNVIGCGTANASGAVHDTTVDPSVSVLIVPVAGVQPSATLPASGYETTPAPAEVASTVMSV